MECEIVFSEYNEAQQRVVIKRILSACWEWIEKNHPEMLEKKEDNAQSTKQTIVFTKPKRYKKK